MDKQKFILTISAGIFGLLIALNLLTVLTPEIGFDALWYHLTLPKLWLLKKQWYFPGGLMYYSVMPRLSETIFIPLISLTGYIGPKLVQFLSGLGTTVMILKISGYLKLNRFYSVMAAFAFYITWLVSWQSGSSYIDLIRTFLEVSALYQLLTGKWLRGSLLLGLAIGTKWLALGSLIIYAIIFGPQLIIPALLLASPWFIIAYYYTGNPIYPIFEPFLSHTLPTLSQAISRIIFSPYYATKPVDDFLTPLAGVFVIISLIQVFRSSGNHKKIALLGVLGVIFSSLTNPPSSRFLLPFLPALVISSMSVVSKLKPLAQTVFQFALLSSFVLIFSLRLVAFEKYLPFLMGKETKEQFLTRLHPKLPDTFIDSDLYIEKNLSGKKILIDKLHNLYYFPFDFDHTSWSPDRSDYEYLVTINEDPDSTDMELVHENPVGVQVFKLK